MKDPVVIQVGVGFDDVEVDAVCMEHEGQNMVTVFWRGVPLLIIEGNSVDNPESFPEDAQWDWLEGSADSIPMMLDTTARFMIALGEIHEDYFKDFFESHTYGSFERAMEFADGHPICGVIDAVIESFAGRLV
jgi:hypothetical protein